MKAIDAAFITFIVFCVGAIIVAISLDEAHRSTCDNVLRELALTNQTVAIQVLKGGACR